jgi:hypothetical protein
MKLEVKDNCPLNNFNPCKKFDCGWFIQIRGKNPQTGEEQDEFGCAIAYLPLMMIENSQQTRQAGASIESFRNEMVKANNETVKALMTREILNKIEKKDK